YIRKGIEEEDDVIIVCNMTPVPMMDYRIGLPKSGRLKEIFNSDLKKYNGTGQYKNTIRKAEKVEWQFRKHSVEITIPPFGMVAFKYSK
ncbi:MAG: 1,4-alpha-glucan branching enzyme, partial [Flavobacteriaceae bacterium]|nr:1,4-alpha-glucan branching enzyme [Flavobacteriaceae bacterium]